MTRLSIGISGLDHAVQQNLLNASNELKQTSLRLATLQRVNRSADDPAAIIGIESLRSELAAIEAADRNASRAGAIAATADRGLSQVSELLNTIQGAVTTAAGGLSEEETAALQLEVNAAVEAINRIGAQTQLGGRRLLDGSTEQLTFSFSADASRKVTLDLPSVQTAQLGGDEGVVADLTSGGPLDLASGNLQDAAATLDAARSSISTTRGKLGAFERNVVETSREVIGGLRENLSAALSDIRDADVAFETSQLVRSELVRTAAIASVRIASDRHQLIGFLLDDR